MMLSKGGRTLMIFENMCLLDTSILKFWEFEVWIYHRFFAITPSVCYTQIIKAHLQTPMFKLLKNQQHCQYNIQSSIPLVIFKILNASWYNERRRYDMWLLLIFMSIHIPFYIYSTSSGCRIVCTLGYKQKNQNVKQSMKNHHQ